MRYALLVTLMACGSKSEPDPTPQVLETTPAVASVPEVEGDPRVPNVAMYPFPSDFWLTQTSDGPRIALDDALNPEGVLAAHYADHDGFSRIPAILTSVGEVVDPDGLPSLAESVLEDSPVLVVPLEGGDPVPCLVEVDLSTPVEDRRALIIRPAVSLDASTTYLVVVRDTLPTQEPVVRSPAMTALLFEEVTDNEVVESLHAAYEPVLALLSDRSIPVESVLQAWTFTTRSEEQVVGPTLAMQDVAGSESLGAWTLLSDEHDGANRLVEGSIELPDFLGDVVEVDAAGNAVQQGTRTVEFLVTIPDTVQEARPIVLFGHGFFSAKEETTWGSLQQSIQPWAVSTLSTDFIGFNEADFLRTAAALSGDAEALERTVWEQLQSHVHFTMLARLVPELAADITGPGGEALIDADRVRYMGISNGGTQGAVILATSPVIDDGVLVVPGGGWSHMLQRAVQWDTLGGVISSKYSDPLELQLVLALTQQTLDPVDILNYSRGLGLEPFAGRGEKRAQFHMAVGDSQVHNMVTEWVARDAGVPLIEPSPRAVWGLNTLQDLDAQGSTDVLAGLYVYDEGYPAQAVGNIPPEDDNGAHETIRDLASYQDHVGAFLEDLSFSYVCEGPCDPQ